MHFTIDIEDPVELTRALGLGLFLLAALLLSVALVYFRREQRRRGRGPGRY